MTAPAVCQPIERYVDFEADWLRNPSRSRARSCWRAQADEARRARPSYGGAAVGARADHADDAECRNRPLGARRARGLPAQPTSGGDHARTRCAPFPGAARTNWLRDAESSWALPDESRVLTPLCLGRGAKRDHQDAGRNQLRGPCEARRRALARAQLNRRASATVLAHRGFGAETLVEARVRGDSSTRRNGWGC